MNNDRSEPLHWLAIYSLKEPSFENNVSFFKRHQFYLLIKFSKKQYIASTSTSSCDGTRCDGKIFNPWSIFLNKFFAPFFLSYVLYTKQEMLLSNFIF